ncbi:TPA: hypothetical protein I6189_002549 [Vibrio cholerae]|nr:hypothetical protein [Vibrio cholerae]
MRKLVLIFLFIFSSSALAAADINIGTFYDYMNHDRNIAVKKIYNFGNETAFVKVSINEIIYDDKGQPDERELSGNGTRDLVASPSHMIIPSNGIQVIRFIYLGSREKERYYRIRFIPVLPEEMNLVSDALNNNSQIQTGVKILTGYGSILFIPPEDVQYKTNVLKKDGKVYIENKGNATIVVDNLERCNEEKKQCTQAEKLHILPEGKREVSYDGYPLIDFDLIEGSKSTFNRISL